MPPVASFEVKFRRGKAPKALVSRRRRRRGRKFFNVCFQNGGFLYILGGIICRLNVLFYTEKWCMVFGNQHLWPKYYATNICSTEIS